MSQIQQNADGTYSKTYSDTELLLMQQLQVEIDTRRAADDQISLLIQGLDNRITVIEGERFSLVEIQNAINANTLRIEAAEERISDLETHSIVDAFSKLEIRRLLVPWKVEEIIRSFDTPTHAMFDEANLTEIKVGYVHYENANIYEPYGLRFSPNTMRRYSISAYTSVPTEVEFLIYYADRLVVSINGAVLETYQEDGGNFGGTQKVFTAELTPGWHTISFLVANETQEGGLVVTSNLVEKVERLSPLSRMSGKFTGDQIQAGTLDERHFSPNMEIILRKIHATTTDGAAGIFGDPDAYGAIQIGDGVISKVKDEPMTIWSDLKVIGYIRDKDGNILDGDGRGGLTTADREKLDSIEWGAEVNQNAFSYVKLVDLPITDTEPFKNVINALLKMDTLRIRGDLGITFDIEKVTEGEGDEAREVQQMVIKNSPTEFKSHLFISTENQDTFAIDPAEGKFQLGRGTVFVYIEGLKQSYSNYYEVDEWTIRLREKLPAGLKVLVEWQEGSPAFAKETIVSLANIPVATRTQDGLMSRFFVEDLYDHKHKMADIEDLAMFTTVEIDDGKNELQKIEATTTDRSFKLKAGHNVKMEKINNTLRISADGPKISAGQNIEVTGSAEEGYTITNSQRLEATRGITIEHINGIDVIKGPIFIEGKGIDFQMVDDATYHVMNNMSLTSVGGIDVVGNAEDGYVIRNTLKLIESGGIEVLGDAVSGFKLRNIMSLEASADGNVTVSGSAATGYFITGRWPSITSGEGIAVDDFGDGKYLVKNTGVTSYNGQTGEVTGVGTLNKVAEGRGIRVAFHGNGDYVVHNTGVVELVDDGIGGGIDVTDLGNQVWKVKNTGIIKNLQGPGISVSTNTQGESTISNTGVLDISAGPGIDVSGATGHVTVRNTGIISLIEGEGIDINTNAQGSATVRNSGVVTATAGKGISVSKTGTNLEITNDGVLEVRPGRGIDISESGGRVTVINDGIVDLVEGEGIDINTNGSGMATIRNDGVLSINGLTGHVEFPSIPTMTASAVPFSGTGIWTGTWMSASSPEADFWYTWGVKLKNFTHYNIQVAGAVDSPGESFRLCLYSGDDDNILDEVEITTLREGSMGEDVFFSIDISYLSDYCITGIHVGGKDINGTAYVRFQRAWLSEGPGSMGDYEV